MPILRNESRTANQEIKLNHFGRNCAMRILKEDIGIRI